MALFNRKKHAEKDANVHLNFMGGPSYDVTDPLARLRVAAASCFFGEPMYYHRDRADKRPIRAHVPHRLDDAAVAHLRSTLNALDPQEWRGLTPSEVLERAIDAALDHDLEGTLKLAAELRGAYHVRVTPQVMLVRAARHSASKGTGLVRRYAQDIVRRPDESATGLAYQLARFGKPIPNALKKAWKDALERADELGLAKYRLESREVGTLDVMNLVHPASDAVNKLARGELKLRENTWESLVSARGASKEAWTDAVQVMGHMALLRNLRNLVQHGVEPAVYTNELRRGAATGRQLPFRYYSAWKALKDVNAPSEVARAVEDALEASLTNLPTFSGRVMSLCDNSGSATGTTTSKMGTVRVSTIANLTAVLTAKRAERGFVGVFGDRLETFEVDSGERTLKALERAEKLGRGVGGGTENGIWLFWDRAIRERQHFDAVFVYSDQQAGHGGLYGTDPKAYRDFLWPSGGHYIDVPKLVATYRRDVNPNVLVFLVQVAGYTDTILPETYAGTFILGGWSDALLRYAAEMSRTFRT